MGALENNQHFVLEGRNIRSVDYREEECVVSGADMQYELQVVGSFETLWGRVFLRGEEESRITVRRDGEDLLIRTEDGDCSVVVKSWPRIEERDLGQCPAGQWGRITHNGTEAALSLEAHAPAPLPEGTPVWPLAVAAAAAVCLAVTLAPF